MTHIVEIEHLRGKVVRVAFDDGLIGEVDLEGSLNGPVFEPLRDEAYFAKAYVDPELETIAWPDGADLAPEFVRDLLLEQDAVRRHG